MLQRVEHLQGLVTYQSPQLHNLGLPHAFSTRHGGVSPPPYRSLNLGLDSCSGSTTAEESERRNIQKNYQRLQIAIGCPDQRLIWVKQVHGREVFAAGAATAHEHPEADAIVTGEAGLLLSIRVADCVPILLADRTGRCVAAIHAGWRGVVAGVLPATINAMQRQFDVSPNDLVAAIGPCIGVDHFEVGPEVADAFDQASLGDSVQRKPDVKPHIDLQLALLTQLRKAGVPDAAIDRNQLCTYRDADDFFSHRRDHGRTGRLAAVIGRKV